MGIVSKGITYLGFVVFAMVVVTLLSSSTVSALSTINVSEWTDRSSVSSWDVVPSNVKKAFYDEIREVREKYDAGRLCSCSYSSCIKCGEYVIKYRMEFDPSGIYIINVKTV